MMTMIWRMWAWKHHRKSGGRHLHPPEPLPFLLLPRKALQSPIPSHPQGSSAQCALQGKAAKLTRAKG